MTHILFHLLDLNNINKTFFFILTHLELNMRVDTCVPVVCPAPQPEEAVDQEVDQQGPEERLAPARRGRVGTGPSCRPGRVGS